MPPFFNSHSKGCPTGPIYWADNSNQLITNQGGELTVGSLYNNNEHYWDDLKTLSSSYPDIMDLQNGANSFYDMSLRKIQGTNQYDPPTASTFALNGGLGAAVQPNARGYKNYLGGINQNTLLGPSDGDMKFNIYPGNSSPTSGPSEFYLHAGSKGVDIKYAAGPAVNYYFSQGPDDIVNGNGLPGGRYVVTVRATDASGDGSYFEWDLPITLCPWTLSPASPSNTDFI